MEKLKTIKTLAAAHGRACETVSRFSGLSTEQVYTGLQKRMNITSAPANNPANLFRAIQTVSRFAGIGFAQAAHSINKERRHEVTRPKTASSVDKTIRKRRRA